MSSAPPTRLPSAMPAQRWTLADALHQRYLNLTGVPVEYDIRPYLRALSAVDAIDLADHSDTALRTRADGIRRRALAREPLNALLPEVYAIVREASARLLGMRPFDVQMAAAVALHRGKLVQLATGEGKTLVAVMPVTLNALTGRGVHVFTANDYLARRDAEWMGPVYRLFGLQVGVIGQEMTRDERRRAYAADVTYVTAKEAGFDFLRDHTADDPALVVQRPPHFVIVDEADFILIDEARVPLVIAGPAPPVDIDHRALAAMVRQLRPGVDFDHDEHGRTIAFTEAGLRHAGTLLGGVALHAPAHHLLRSAVHVALHAEALLRRDRDYIVRDGRVELVDEWTGRVAYNRHWPHGIQPAVEAKEGVDVRAEGRILGSVPIQHFVRRYPRIAAMTATAVTAAEEFRAFFGLTTVVFPSNRPCRRADAPDVVFTHRAAKAAALADEIARVHATGRPILVGTASVAESEELARTLRARRVKCRVLNARHDAREARIVAHAGTLGAVTVSTNMAGRGVDIVLGGGDPRRRDEVAALGGLYVMGTNRHESRRIDDQLRGRAGRQGDPGSSRFFISLEDDLIQRYGVMALIPRKHWPARQDAPIDHAIVRREIARAQRVIEGQNFEIRQTLWRYSQLVDDQRHLVYQWRQALLDGEATPDLCAAGAPDHYRALVGELGADAVRRVEQRVTMHVLDRAWADHLALIEDVREGIHLRRFGGREPIAEFHQEIVAAFGRMTDRVRDDTLAAFTRLRAENRRVDLARVGVSGSSSMWTYLINDDPFSTLSLSLMATRNVGLSAGAGLLAVMYWPVTLAASVALFLRRSRRQRERTDTDRRTDAP